MSLYIFIGRISLGILLVGIGLLHFFFPGINAIIWPKQLSISPQQYWLVYFGAVLLIGAGIGILSGTKVFIISLIMAVFFLLLFFFSHLTAFLSAVDTAGKIKYWTNLNKVLALSGGFLMLASVSPSNLDDKTINIISIIGSYFFAIMLFFFGLGHLLSTSALSAMVPDYIPFKKFWTFAGGIVLIGSALSFFIRFQIEKAALLLALTLFIWLLTLHIYYAIRFPNWQGGENFIGVLTSLAFCGTALLIVQRAKNKRIKKKNGNESQERHGLHFSVE